MGLRKFKEFKLGDQGVDVRSISAALKKHGSTIKLTYKFHIGMRSAVCAFQRKHGLPATGVVDKKTRDLLLLPKREIVKMVPKKK